MGLYFHKLCKAELASQRKLDQARTRKQKQMATQQLGESRYSSLYPSASCSADSEPTKRLSRSNTGLLHEKNLCVWCMKGEDKKHPTRDKWCIIQKEDAWNTFQIHTVYLEDSAMRDRILAVIDSVHDPFATEIRYHRACWKKYIRPLYDLEEDTGSKLHLQNVRFTEVRHMFFKHVRTCVLDMHEPRTLQGLLLDYNSLMKNYGFDTSSTKTSKLKQILQAHFGSNLGFHDRYHKNQSTIVYDMSAGGTYVEAAIYSWGISDEQLLNTAARRLKTKLTSEDSMKWPPAVEDLENVEEPHILLRQFLAWLKNPAEKQFDGPCPDSQVTALSSLLFSYITGKRTAGSFAPMM